MATSTFQVRPYHRLPLHAPLYFHNDHIQGTGALWNVSREGCRMDANVPLHAGTVVELMLLLGPTGAVYVKAATVCWTRGLECGLRFILLQPGEAAHLERYVSKRIVEAPHAQYRSR
jgi:hypothetical protein